MNDPALDRQDRTILAALQQNGRLTNNELADQIGLSPSQCSRRRARLEETGLISGYHAVIDRERAGFALVSIISVTLATHTEGNAERFARLVRASPNILEAHALTGEMDLATAGQVETGQQAEQEAQYGAGEDRRGDHHGALLGGQLQVGGDLLITLRFDDQAAQQFQQSLDQMRAQWAEAADKTALVPACEQANAAFNQMAQQLQCE